MDSSIAGARNPESPPGWGNLRDTGVGDILCLSSDIGRERCIIPECPVS